MTVWLDYYATKDMIIFFCEADLVTIVQSEFSREVQINTQKNVFLGIMGLLFSHNPVRRHISQQSIPVPSNKWCDGGKCDCLGSLGEKLALCEARRQKRHYLKYSNSAMGLDKIWTVSR